MLTVGFAKASRCLNSSASCLGPLQRLLATSAGFPSACHDKLPATSSENRSRPQEAVNGTRLVLGSSPGATTGAAAQKPNESIRDHVQQPRCMPVGFLQPAPEQPFLSNVPTQFVSCPEVIHQRRSHQTWEDICKDPTFQEVFPPRQYGNFEQQEPNSPSSSSTPPASAPVDAEPIQQSQPYYQLSRHPDSYNNCSSLSSSQYVSSSSDAGDGSSDLSLMTDLVLSCTPQELSELISANKPNAAYLGKANVVFGYWRRTPCG